MRVGPPEDVKASDLFRKLLETPFPTKVVPFPRKGADGNWISNIRIRVLSQDDLDKARELAQERLDKRKFTAEQLTGVVLKELAADTVARELLAMACLTEESYGDDANGQPIHARIFVDGSQLGRLTGDEIAVLFNAWQMIQRNFGPLESNIDVDAWVNRLVEGGDALPLAFLGSQDVAELAYALSVRICSIFKILGPLYETLPSTSQSALDKCFSGMSFAGLQRLESESIGSESSEVEIEDAIALTEKLRAKQGLIDAANE